MRGGGNRPPTKTGYGESGPNPEYDNRSTGDSSYQPAHPPIGNRNIFDAMKQRPSSRNINNPVADFSDANASRVEVYGKPNMGGERFRRRNEMPTRDDLYG